MWQGHIVTAFYGHYYVHKLNEIWSVKYSSHLCHCSSQAEIELIVRRKNGSNDIFRENSRTKSGYLECLTMQIETIEL